MVATHDHKQPANISAALCPSCWIIWLAFPPLWLGNQTSARHITGPAWAKVQLFWRIRCWSWTSVRDLLYPPPGYKSIGCQGNAKQKCWPRNETLQHNCAPVPHDTCCGARLTEPKGIHGHGRIKKLSWYSSCCEAQGHTKAPQKKNRLTVWQGQLLNFLAYLPETSLIMKLFYHVFHRFLPFQSEELGIPRWLHTWHRLRPKGRGRKLELGKERRVLREYVTRPFQFQILN